MVQRVKLADNPQLCLPLIVLHMTSCGQAQGRTTDGRMIISASCVITLQSFSERGDINCSTSSLCCRKKIEFASECNVYVTNNCLLQKLFWYARKRNGIQKRLLHVLLLEEWWISKNWHKVRLPSRKLCNNHRFQYVKDQRTCFMFCTETISTDLVGPAIIPSRPGHCPWQHSPPVLRRLGPSPAHLVVCLLRSCLFK